jgi:hypothetical protein
MNGMTVSRCPSRLCRGHRRQGRAYRAAGRRVDRPAPRQVSHHPAAGLRFIIPYIDIVSYKVTTKDIILDVQEQEVITRDNAVIVVNAIAFIKVTDPVKAVYGVEDYSEAIRNMIMTTLRSIVGDMELDQALSSRDMIKARLKAGVADEALDWGLTVKSVEIQDIKPSQSMQRAMEMQASAERERKAMVTRAEGEKQSMILTAEARLESAKRDAKPRSPSPRHRRRRSPRSPGLSATTNCRCSTCSAKNTSPASANRRVRQRQARAPACRPAEHPARTLPARTEERRLTAQTPFRPEAANERRLDRFWHLYRFCPRRGDSTAQGSRQRPEPAVAAQGNPARLAQREVAGQREDVTGTARQPANGHHFSRHPPIMKVMTVSLSPDPSPARGRGDS